MKKILEGIRVIDLTHWIVGPDATAYLADMGADVFHVEQKGVGDQYRGISFSGGASLSLVGGRHAYFEAMNRNKRGLALDLKTPAGKEIFHQLVKNSDVFVSNLDPQAIANLGLDYDTLREINPRLIYAVSSSFGDKGPDADMPALDMVVQARSGLMMASGSGTDPCLLAPGIADGTGALTLGFGIVSALLARERFGMGQEVPASALGSMLLTLRQIISHASFTEQNYPRASREEALSPVYTTYKCKDDSWIVIAAFRDTDWAPFCQAMGMPELAKDPRYDDLVKRMTEVKELTKLFDGVFAQKTRQEWMEILRQAKLLHGPVNKITDLFSDPQILDNEYIREYDHPVLGKIRLLGSPWKFSETPLTYDRPAPEIGEHTEEILIEVCGYSWDDIERFAKEGAI